MKKECGVMRTMKVIGGKWTIQILHALCERKKRFGELERELEGISPRTLSLRLQQLEHNHIVSKHSFPTMPPRVEYALTAKGTSLKQIIATLDSWGNTQ